MKQIFSIFFMCCFSVVAYAQDTKSIKADILLDSTLINQLSINTTFINSIEYTPNGLILLSSPNQFYLLGMGGIVPLFKKWENEADIESFTVMGNGILLIISGNALYQAYSETSFVKIVDIPDSDMGITSKYEDVYVFDRTMKSDKKYYSIYRISENKKFTPLVTIPTPILSVFEQPLQLIFSTKNRLLSVDINTKTIFQILALPQEENIISIVGDTINHAFYFSTNNTIYRIKSDKIEIISEDFGGILRYDGEGLLIFDPEKQLIVRLRNNLLYPNANNIEMN